MQDTQKREWEKLRVNASKQTESMEKIKLSVIYIRSWKRKKNQENEWSE
jgi:hypothetical protein